MLRSLLSALVALTLLAHGAPTRAQAADLGDVPAQLFTVAPGGSLNYIGTQSIRVLAHLKPSFGLYLNYAYQPLVLQRMSNGEEVELLQHQLQADLLAAIGFFDVLELGVAMPVTLYQTQGDSGVSLATEALSATVAGDLRIFPKWRIFGPDPSYAEGFGVALVVPITVPTGSREDLQGNGGVTVEPRVVAEVTFSESVRVAASLGYLIRTERQRLLNIDVGHELTYAAALEWQPEVDKWAVILDLKGRASADPDISPDGEEMPAEIALAGRYWPADNHALTFGLARGLTRGYGAPEVRAFVGYSYTPMPDKDRDGDGILDNDDRCPDEPEDVDAFEDTDGCPDPDNDKDGILDVDDECPLDPEDMDAFQDEDGCPDPDNDKDGIADAADKCPLQPEDKDGFEDEDGCPDTDNDGDGILDDVDKCPLEAEDKDNFQDDDGCPETDNDGDGILDDLDQCPLDAKNACKAATKGKRIFIYDKVHFKYNKAVIRKRSYPVLDAVVKVLQEWPAIQLIEIQGHTDSDGKDRFNMSLSQRRAESVLKYISDKGIDPKRMRAKGFGETKPIKPNTTKANKADNRRVEFHIVQ